MLIGGIILLVVGLGFFLWRRAQTARLAQMAAAETLSCAGVERFCRDVGESAGATQVEVKGVIEPRAALKAELSGQDCVACKTRVEREWEEEKWEGGDSKTGGRMTTHRGSETVAQSERLEPFYVRDESGRVLVDPQGAEIDWVRSVERFERGDVPSGQWGAGLAAAQVLGGLAGALAGNLPQGRKTIGYRYQEWILPAQRPVYVLGGAALRSGEACLQRPAGSGKKFLVSLKSEEQLAAGARRAVTWLAVVCAACWVAGAALIAASLFKR